MTSTLKSMTHTSEVLFLDSTDLSVPEAMGAATALCYPSLFEGFGIPILEAFAAEVPVITSNVSSMPEVAGEAALLVDPKSTDDIARAMSRLVTDPQLAKTLIEKGRSQKTLFSWDNSAGLIYEALTQVAQKK